MPVCAGRLIHRLMRVSESVQVEEKMGEHESMTILFGRDC